MTFENENDFIFLLLGAALVLCIAFIFLVKFIVQVQLPFISERDYIRMEIERSFGEEKVRWKNELKWLYISLIPFVGMRIVEKSRRKIEEQIEEQKEEQKERL